MCMKLKWKHHIFRSLILKIYIGCRFASANWNVLMKLSFFFPNIHLSHITPETIKKIVMYACVYDNNTPITLLLFKTLFSLLSFWRTIKRISTINHVKFLYLSLSWCLEKGWKILIYILSISLLIFFLD